MLRFVTICLFLVSESFSRAVDENWMSQPNISELLRKHPTWSFELESIEAYIKERTIALKRAVPNLTIDDLRQRIKEAFGPETTHIVRKTGDPKWPKYPPKFFDAREQWSECAELIGYLNDESNCLADSAVVAASVMSDRYCIYANGTSKSKLSGEMLAGCAQSCTHYHPAYIVSAFNYANKIGIPTGGYFNSQSEGCLPYEHSPCIHSNTSYPHFPISPRNGGMEMDRKDDSLKLCSDNPRYDYDCPTKCSNKKYRKSLKDDLLKTSTWYTTSRNEFVIRSELMTYGPVASSVLLWTDFLNKPSDDENWYYHDENEGVKILAWDKYIKFIGWGEDHGTKYWLAVNSFDQWGTKSEDKIFKIFRGENYQLVEDLSYGAVYGEI